MAAKILFTDLDGTLLNKESKVSEYTMSVLRAFHDAGNIIVPASGRPLMSIQEVIQNAGLHDIVDYIIAYNGALVWDCLNEKPIWEATVDLDTAKIVQRLAMERNIHVHTYSDEHVITPCKDPETEFYTIRIHLPIIYTPDPVGYIAKPPYKVLAISLDNHDALEELRAAASDVFGDSLGIVYSNSMLLEFFNTQAGKGNAVIELCKLLSIDIKDSFAAGDEENDISMLEAAGCGIGMLNARDIVKEHADIITEYDNAADGLAHYISQLID